jgi:H+/Cl- antiporter ClcA
MVKNKNVRNAIPVSSALLSDPSTNNSGSSIPHHKKRLLLVSFVAILIAALVSCVAKFLVFLIYFFTNIAFFGRWSFEHASPADNHLGLFVILIPVAGGLLVGLMALYGSKAIRGHGIPEAMEQILTNQSKIHPSIAWLKPLSSAISIGTGGPFGAEGPIIATGGALGSAIGQIMKITHYERKVLLAAGATAGMSAIFGTPVAGIFLAIELLLFEFSPRSILPVALACITGAAGHHLLFESGPVFPAPDIAIPGNMALAVYSIMGLLIGIIAAFVTKAVYFIEDGFEKLPVHWVLWPAIGGFAVGIVGYFVPHTLGVGYDNITALLSGNMPFKVVVFLCVFKFISWAIALGSGTSGGTLAPLLTIGGATGALLGMAALYIFPNSGVILPLAAMVGMSAMFAGASRALITSVIFALEASGRYNALLPLLCACTGSYFVSYFLMKNTIMTEKIARRGVSAPISFEADVLAKVFVKDMLAQEAVVISNENTIAEIKNWLAEEGKEVASHLIAVNHEGRFTGIVSIMELYMTKLDLNGPIEALVKRSNASVSASDTLQAAVGLMARKETDVLPVLDESNATITGIISYKEIIRVYQQSLNDHEHYKQNISIKRNSIKILLHGKMLATKFKSLQFN